MWAGLAQGRLGILGKLAFQMVDFLQGEDTLHTAAVLEGVAQSHLEELVDNPQVWKDTCFVVHLPPQMSLPGWMPAMTAIKQETGSEYKQLSFSNMFNTVQPPSSPTQTDSSLSAKDSKQDGKSA